MRLLRAASFFVLLSFLPILLGCGYSVHRRSMLPYPEIEVGAIENKTLEPKLEDRLRRALVAEFMRQGFTVRPGADHRLEGTITSFELTALSQKKSLTVEYQVAVQADFRVGDREGKVVPLPAMRSPFIVTFPVAEGLENLLADRNRAEEQAVSDLATRLVSAVIFR